jgi:hypothetical protein
MTFWAHPEANYGVGEIVYPGRAAPVSLPQVKMSTGRHPHSLIHTEGYTGFESLYGDTIHVTDIGREWDRTLIMYTEGVRKTPAWGICGLDFHKEGMNGWSWLDRGQTVFLVHDRSREAVLDAMRHGRMYAVYQGGSAKLRMDLFTLSSKATGQEAVSGGTIGSMGKPLRVTLELTLTGGDAVPIRVDLIDSGKVLSTIHGETLLQVVLKGADATPCPGTIEISEMASSPVTSATLRKWRSCEVHSVDEGSACHHHHPDVMG